MFFMWYGFFYDTSNESISVISDSEIPNGKQSLGLISSPRKKCSKWRSNKR